MLGNPLAGLDTTGWLQSSYTNEYAAFGAGAVEPSAASGMGTQALSAQDTSTGSMVGVGDLTGDHNTPIHVGGLILLGLGVTIALKLMGFRFVVDVGVGR